MLRSIVSDDRVKLGPSRTEYTVTEKGQLEFKDLLESALVSVDKRRAALETSIRFLKGLPVEERPSDPSKHPELIGIWVHYVENEAATTERSLTNVRAGRYEFNTEPGGKQ